MELRGKSIALLKGGPGSEREVSLATARGVGEALRSLGAEVVEVDVTGGSFRVPDGVVAAFNVIHGTFGEDGGLQSLLEERRIPYTGAGSRASALAFDKVRSKERFAAAGVPTPAWQVLPLEGAEAGDVRLPLPVVMKPAREGSSVGVHLIREAGGAGAELLDGAIADLKQYGREALVEALIDGRELTVGILGDRVLPVVEIRPRSGFYDISNRYPWMTGGDGGSDYFCPAELGEEATRAVQEAALGAHRALGIEVYSRVDVLLDGDGRPWVLEVNTIPGMTETSLLPKAALAAGIDYASLCARILELSLEVKR